MDAASYTRQDVHRYLKGCAWPGSPVMCAQIARDNGAPASVLADLEAVPTRVYLSEAELTAELERMGAFARAEGSATMGDEAQVQVGMRVVGSDGGAAGKVKEVRAHDFVLDRRLARDLCVPLDAVRQVEAGQVVLNISAEDVNYQRWECTKLF